MEACIVIAKLIGILNSEQVNMYKIDCSQTVYNVIINEDEFKEVNVLKINSDLSYNIEIKEI